MNLTLTSTLPSDTLNFTSTLPNDALTLTSTIPSNTFTLTSILLNDATGHVVKTTQSQELRKNSRWCYLREASHGPAWLLGAHQLEYPVRELAKMALVDHKGLGNSCVLCLVCVTLSFFEVRERLDMAQKESAGCSSQYSTLVQ